ncbi:MAG: cytochrome b/b6 domain-containing protein [Rhodobacteraceae bacterium]|nr:cytochrome b/b6 domain-containing protein [Paracoccaceae bacterium]
MIRGPITIIKTYHWLLVVAVGFSWLAADELELWHEYAGYVALALIAMRIVWHFAGPRSASMTRYFRGAKKALAYVRDLLFGRNPRALGTFPFAGLSVVVLLITVTATSVSGWLMVEPSRMAILQELPSLVAPAYADGDDYGRYGDDDDDYGFGGEAMEEIHEFLANFLLLAIFSHIALMVYNARNKSGRPAPPGGSVSQG